MAQVYKNSKICLNINVEQHKGFNPRNFDIMYVGSLLLTDKQDLNGINLKGNEEFIMCNNSKEMINNIDYYLKNNEKRKLIAERGRKKIVNNYLFENTLNSLFI